MAAYHQAWHQSVKKSGTSRDVGLSLPDRGQLNDHLYFQIQGDKVQRGASRE